MVNHIITHEISQDKSKIVKLEVKTEIELNSGGVQTLTDL